MVDCGLAVPNYHLRFTYLRLQLLGEWRMADRGLVTPIYHLPFTIFVINNPGKAFGFEACAPDQRAINVRLRHQTCDIIRLDRAAVNYSQVPSGLIRVPIHENAPDKRVHFLRLLRRRRTSGTDGPNRLVGDDDTVEI